MSNSQVQTRYKFKTRMKGLIFNIQRFSIHDGPGIRATVFMKGCPLLCKWCCNPESQKPTLDILVQDVKCIQCGKCREICIEEAIISIEGNNRIDLEKCTHCLECVQVCPSGALETSGIEMGISEIMEEVRKDTLFYKNSKGGITISGGEPLLQWKFTKDLLEECKREGLNTVLDTSGYASWEIISQVLEFVDLALFDIKHLDTDLHLKGTGVHNDLIINNLEKTACMVKTWLRFPLLPGYNDSIENIEKIASLAYKVGVEKVSILAYHEWGKPKYKKLGREYLFSPEGEISKSKMEEIITLFSRKGVKVTLNN